MDKKIIEKMVEATYQMNRSLGGLAYTMEGRQLDVAHELMYKLSFINRNLERMLKESSSTREPS